MLDYMTIGYIGIVPNRSTEVSICDFFTDFAVIKYLEQYPTLNLLYMISTPEVFESN